MSQTDLQTLSNLFATTYNPDPNVRKAAELQIRRIGGQEGVLTALLQIIGASEVELATRQACAVYLKNRVYSSYSVQIEAVRQRPDYAPIAQSDRDALKRSLLPLLASSPSRSVTLQLSHTLKNVAARDYPESWPTLIDEIKALLTSSKVEEVGSGCVAALEIVRAFRFRQDDEILAGIVTGLFPTLVSIASQIVATPPAEASPEIPFMLHYILKTYKTSTMVRLTPHQQSAESLVPWGRLLFQVVNLQIPAEVVPQDEEERERSEWWKAKKWAYATLGRLFHRYGNPSQLPSPMQKEYGAFAQHFVTAFAPEIFKTYLHQIDLFVSGQAWLSNKCQYNIFQFLTECVKPKSTWALLKPHFENLVSSFIFPHLCFTPNKQELWASDPVDYVRTSVDEYENYNSPVSAATSFLFSLASNRTKTTFMPILGFINNILRSNPDSPRRFGALNMTAALGPFIMRHPEVKTSMEQFLNQYVLPEFSSGDGYMRAIACEVVGTMEKGQMVWTEEKHLNDHFTAVANALNDPELPVRVHAALALTEILQNHEQARAAVAPQVGKVIQDLLKLTEETDLDLLNHSMDKMVEYFQEDLVPVAAQLAARLCDSYMRLVREALAHEEGVTPDLDAESLVGGEDDDKTYAAMGVAKTIGTVVSSVDSSPEILAQVQENIVPIIVFTLEKKMLDLFDNVYDLVDVLTFKLHSIAPSMWPVFELTYKLFKSDAIDFLDEMLPALDNFVSYGADTFKQRPDYREMMVDIYTTAMNSEQLGENDRVNGCKLAESMMLNLRDHIDDALQTFVGTSLAHLDIAETSALRLANLEVLINAVLYNPGAALRIMESFSAGSSRLFFDKWFEAINNADSRLPRVHDKKLSILALCALLELDPSEIPAGLQEGWPGIVAGALKLFKDLPKAIAARKALEEAFEEDDDEGSEGQVFNLEDDDGDVYDEESAYLEMLAKENMRLRKNAGGAVDVADDDDDEEDVESDIEEELGYFSPLDAVNPYSSFKQALAAFQVKNGAGYQAGTTSLNMEQQTFLIEVMNMSENPEGQA